MPPPAPFTDHTYATKEGVPLPLRVFPLPTAPASKDKQPWTLYLRGGAYTGWSHYLPHPWVVPGLRTKGIPVVSAGYRFTPACTLAEMLDDVEDAYNWVIKQDEASLASLLGTPVDPARCIIVGESSGGTVATLLAHRLHRSGKIKAVVDIYGVVDSTVARWSPENFVKPADEADALSGQWTEDEIKAAIRAAPHDKSKAMTYCPFDDSPEDAVDAMWGIKGWKWTERAKLQRDMGKWLCNNNQLSHVALGAGIWEKGQDDEAWKQLAREYSITHLVNKEEGYPPTVLMHGEKDDDVPLAQSQELAAKLRSLDVPVLESYYPDGGHVYDWKFITSDVEGYDKYIQPTLDFVDQWARA